MEQEGTQEPARFDPRIAEPPAVPPLIPVLRRAGAEDAAAAGDLALDPEDPGLLDLDPARVDLTCFDEAAERALEPGVDPRAALPHAEHARTWWRGSPFAGLDTPRLVVERARLEQRWSVA